MVVVLLVKMDLTDHTQHLLTSVAKQVQTPLVFDTLHCALFGYHLLVQFKEIVDYEGGRKGTHTSIRNQGWLKARGTFQQVFSPLQLLRRVSQAILTKRMMARQKFWVLQQLQAYRACQLLLKLRQVISAFCRHHESPKRSCDVRVKCSWLYTLGHSKGMSCFPPPCRRINCSDCMRVTQGGRITCRV